MLELRAQLPHGSTLRPRPRLYVVERLARVGSNYDEDATYSEFGMPLTIISYPYFLSSIAGGKKTNMVVWKASLVAE